MDKSQLETARFMMKYLDHVNGQQYRNYFAGFNEKMFAQVRIKHIFSNHDNF